nr:hypothetical protein [Bacteroidota bacterium]
MRIKITTIAVLVVSYLFLFSGNIKAQEELAAYFNAATLEMEISDAANKVYNALKDGGFEILGDYHPESNKDLFVVAYTRKDLQQICLRKDDRGALASILKIGFIKKEGIVDVSMLNPMYVFYAYLGDHTDKNLSELQKIDSDIKASLSKVGNGFTPFGGSEEADDLKKYRYMAFMPRFSDPVELNEFSTFKEGLTTINKNLDAGKGNTTKVYELDFPEKEIAIFGIGLLDTEKGEAHFLPIIGEENIAAMPYEIILQGNEATMLHGKYRFALHWPELTMGEFMKIMSTPGDVEDFMEELTK